MSDLLHLAVRAEKLGLDRQTAWNQHAEVSSFVYTEKVIDGQHILAAGVLGIDAATCGYWVLATYIGEYLELDAPDRQVQVDCPNGCGKVDVECYHFGMCDKCGSTYDTYGS